VQLSLKKNTLENLATWLGSPTSCRKKC